MIQLSVSKALRNADGNMSLDIQFNIKKGEFVTLYGASGAGKTSILNILAGLLNVDQGKIKVDKTIWLDTQKKINLKPQKRNVGFVFQDYALFPNMTVRKNLEYALAKGQANDIVEELIAIMELGALQHQKPISLSGGQQQRVSLARALVQRPKLLLLDEPLSALDTKLRTKLKEYIIKIHKKYQLTTIMVSHDFEEIVKLSDRVLVIEKGKIIRQGVPDEIFDKEESGSKFQLTATVLTITPKEDLYVVLVKIPSEQTIEFVCKPEEAVNLQKDDQVIVYSESNLVKIQKLI